MHEFKTLFWTIIELIQNWVYPEHILNHSEFSHDMKDKGRTLSGLQMQNEYRIEAFIDARKFKLNTFLELSCLECGDKLEDDDEVVKLQCDDQHLYHVDCLRNFLLDNLVEDHKCAKCR